MPQQKLSCTGCHLAFGNNIDDTLAEVVKCQPPDVVTQVPILLANMDFYVWSAVVERTFTVSNVMITKSHG